MVYAFTQDVPIDRAFYKRITDGLGTEPPTGLLVHLAIERPEGGLRYIDVWETEQDFNRFAEECLHPVVHTLLGDVFGNDLPPEPERVPLSVLDTWGPGAALGRP